MLWGEYVYQFIGYMSEYLDIQIILLVQLVKFKLHKGRGGTTVRHGVAAAIPDSSPIFYFFLYS